MKYKVGDFVKVRSDLNAGNYYGELYFNMNMLDFKGKIVHIAANENYYYIFEDNQEWSWNDEMFEPATEEDAKKYFEEYVKSFKGYDIKVEIKKKEPILDKKEKEYLSAVIKPFRDRVKCIAKYYEKGYQYISINVIPIGKFYNDLIELPRFKVNTMYKGMIPHKEYSLEELGI